MCTTQLQYVSRATPIFFSVLDGYAFFFRRVLNILKQGDAAFVFVLHECLHLANYTHFKRFPDCTVYTIFRVAVGVVL
jgi:hypothetical protein